MTSTDSLTAQPEPTIPDNSPSRNPLTLFLGITIKPRDTFNYLREQGGWTWLMPFVLVLLLTLISRAVAAPIERAQVEAAMAAFQAQLQNASAESEGPVFFSGGPGVESGDTVEANPADEFLFQYGLPLGGAVRDLIGRGVVLFGVVWLLGGRPSFGSMFRMGGWTLVPTIVRLVVVTVVMIVSQRIPSVGLLRAFEPTTISVDASSGSSMTPGMQVIPFGPGGAALAGPSFGSLFTQNLLSTIDVYTLWGLGLLGIGVAVTARVSWIKGSLAVLIYWGLTLMLTTLLPLISFAIGSMLGGGPMIVGR